MRITHQTTRCVRCGKKAVLWAGWVEGAKGAIILAGWCSRTCDDVWRTCHGRWTRKMGKGSAV